MMWREIARTASMIAAVVVAGYGIAATLAHQHVNLAVALGLALLALGVGALWSLVRWLSPLRGRFGTADQESSLVRSLDRELSRTVRHGAPFVMVAVLGKRSLTLGAIHARLRTSDIAIRGRSHHYIILMTETRMEQAQSVMERMALSLPIRAIAMLDETTVRSGMTAVGFDARYKSVTRQGQGKFILGAVALMGISVVLCSFIVRNLALFAPGYSPADRVSSIFLLLSEIYTCIQGIGYFIGVAQAARVPNVARRTRLARRDVPSVAIYIATYNEPAEIIEETVNAVTLLDYPNKQIYINCDHHSTEQAEIVAAIARRHHVHFIHRTPNVGFKAGGINSFLQRLGRDVPAADLLCIFDADSVPTPTFLREMIPYFLDEPRLAFVQAPQFYGNAPVSAVATAAGQQQTTFAHFISEGKQQAQAMFFCGTNVVFRVAALRDIGGLRTDSVTEDFATSLLLHRRGWRSQYCNAAYVTGMGPATLQAYWTQQGRWALGNLESFLAAIPQIFFWRGFRFAQRWEYFLSGSYYFVGVNTLITLITLIMPTLYLLFNVRPLMLAPLAYVVAFLPYVLLTNWFFFATMGRRGYHWRSLFLAQCLSFVTFPVYVGAAVAALLRRKRGFAVTPKGAGDVLPWRALLPHLVLGALLVAAIITGMLRLFSERNLALLVNILWCAYHLALLSTILIFNQPEREMHMPEMLAAERPIVGM